MQYLSSFALLLWLLHRLHILSSAEVNTYAEIDVCGGHILRNRDALVVYRKASIDIVSTEEDVESCRVDIQRPSEYARLISIEECVAE